MIWIHEYKYSCVPNKQEDPNKRGGGKREGVETLGKIKLAGGRNKWGRGGEGGNFGKIKGKGLFGNEIQF